MYTSCKNGNSKMSMQSGHCEFMKWLTIMCLIARLHCLNNFIQCMPKRHDKLTGIWCQCNGGANTMKMFEIADKVQKIARGLDE